MKQSDFIKKKAQLAIVRELMQEFGKYTLLAVVETELENQIK